MEVVKWDSFANVTKYKFEKVEQILIPFFWTIRAKDYSTFLVCKTDWKLISFKFEQTI